MSEKVINLKNHDVAPASALHKLVEGFKAWNARRVAKAELRAMPAHLLNDIGVRRELIDDYVDGLVARRTASVVGLERNKPVRETNTAKAA